MSRLNDKLQQFVTFTEGLGSLSRCKRDNDQNGAIVVDGDLTNVRSIGFNGPSSGRPNDSCRGKDAVGYCGCIHAEANAVAKLDRDLSTPLVMICSLSPCEHCAGLIVNSKSIEAVVYLREYRTRDGLISLDKGGILHYSIKSVQDRIENEARGWPQAGLFDVICEMDMELGSGMDELLN